MIVSTIINLLLIVKHLFNEHILASKHSFDSIIDVPNGIVLSSKQAVLQYGKCNRLSENSKYFLGPFLLYVVYFVDTVWILYKHDFNYPDDPMPELLGHKMFPRMFWRNSDVILNVAMACILVVYYHLWRGHGWYDERHYMFLISHDGENGQELLVNRKLWDKESSLKLIRIRNQNAFVQKYVSFGSFTLCVLYCDFHYLNRPWIDGWKDWLTFLLYYHQMIWYNMNAMVSMFFHFLFMAQYIIEKQKCLISKLKTLEARLSSKKKRNRSSFPQLRRKFQSINSDLAYQYSEIRAYNRFWSIHLTMQFAFATIIICYSVYCNLFLFQEASVEGLFYFVVFPIEFAFMMFAVLLMCSLVDRNNTQCYALNVKCCMLFQFHFKRESSPRILANIEKIATNRNLTRCCFRLANGYRLDSSAFNLAIYIISTLFIMLVKKNEYYQRA